MALTYRPEPDKILSPDKALEIILKSYRGYYDITEKPDSGEPLLGAFCEYHQRDEKYVLTSKAKLWETKEHEYAYVYLVDRLDEETAARLVADTLVRAKALVKPVKNHMASYACCLVLCGSMTPEAARVIKKSRYRKSFRFSWYGWMELRSAAIPLSGGPIVSNRVGRDTAKFLYRVFQPRKKTFFGKKGN